MENSFNVSGVPDYEKMHLSAENPISVFEGGRSVSQSKLEHLLDIAEDLPSSDASVENICLPLTSGLFFAGLGGAIVYSSLPEAAKIISIACLLIGGIASVELLISLFFKYRKSKCKKSKIVKELENLLNGINNNKKY